MTTPTASFEQIITAYLAAMDAGTAVDRGAWIARYPAHAEALRRFFDDEDLLNPQTTPAGPALDAPGRRPSASRVDATASLGVHAAPAAPQADATAHLPVIEGYRLLGVLGQGGMGIVYRAQQEKLNRVVALKVLPAMIGRANPQAVVRFRREATAAARLHHTNIIPIYDFGECHHAWYYAMELIDGLPLNDVIGRLRESDVANAAPTRLAEVLRGLPAGDGAGASPREGSSAAYAAAGSSSGRGRPYYRQVAHWMADAADALQYAHADGIVHRDIKPSNFILSSDGRIMIADFGLALVAGEESMTLTGSLVGTLRYMSPEQAMAKRMKVDHRTDLWSLGAVMYELLTFQPAFAGADQKEVLGEIITRDPTAPRKVYAGVPRELETICFKTLEKSPGARYPTARALAEDLRRYINDLPITVRPPGPLGRSLKFVRRHKAGVAGVAAIVVTVLLALTARQWMKSSVALRQERRDFLVDRGNDQIKVGQFAAAEASLQEARSIDPDHAATLFSLARLKKERFSSPEHDGSLQVLNDAEVLCRQALQVEPNNVGGLNAHAVILRKLGRSAEARAAYARAVEIDPGKAYLWNNLAVLVAHEGDLLKAEALAQKAAELATAADGFSGTYWRSLASIRLYRQDPAALADVEHAIQGDDRDPGNWLFAARIKLALGGETSIRAALDDAKHADRLARELDGHIKRIRGLAHLRNGEFSEAIEQAGAAIRLKDQACINGLVRAIAHARLGQSADGRASLQLALDQWPDELRAVHAVAVSSDRGVLWLDTTDELNALRAEAETAIGAGP